RAMAGQEFYKRVIPLEEIREKALELIQYHFPEPNPVSYSLVPGSTSKEFEVVERRPKNLSRGFHAYSFGTSSGSAGFVIRHLKSGDSRINKILAVMEHGHKSYVMRPRAPRRF